MRYLKDALKLIATEGMIEPEWRKAKIRKKIERDFRKHKWNLNTLRSVDLEWQWRICCARIQLGATDFEGWHLRKPRDGHIPTHYPKWEGQEGKLLVLGEQGIGDEVMFAGQFDLLPDCSIECDDRLASIFQRSFPQHEFFPRVDLRECEWDTGFDYQTFMGELPKIYGLKYPVNYLIPDPEKVEYWASKLPEDPVGIVFAGRQANIDPDLLKIDGNPVSLQYGDVTHPPWAFVPDIDLKEDIEDVFAITALLKGMVGIPNSNMHFASSLGIPCEIILTPGEGEIFNALQWRWGLSDSTPWCPTAKIYRSPDAYLRELQRTERKSA